VFLIVPDRVFDEDSSNTMMTHTYNEVCYTERYNPSEKVLDHGQREHTQVNHQSVCVRVCV